MAGDLFMFFNKSKKYIDIVNTKGIFSNTYDERYPQTIVNQLVLKHFKRRKKHLNVFLSDGTAAAAMQ